MPSNQDPLVIDVIYLPDENRKKLVGFFVIVGICAIAFTVLPGLSLGGWNFQEDFFWGILMVSWFLFSVIARMFYKKGALQIREKEYAFRVDGDTQEVTFSKEDTKFYLRNEANQKQRAELVVVPKDGKRLKLTFQSKDELKKAQAYIGKSFGAAIAAELPKSIPEAITLMKNQMQKGDLKLIINGQEHPMPEISKETIDQWKSKARTLISIIVLAGLTLAFFVWYYQTFASRLG